MTRQERDAAIVASYREGRVVREIAAHHDLTQQHVYRVLAAAGVSPNRSKANRWREQGHA